ncbi:MAG: Xaa-Pro peptidase family protein [Planctomycetaceae bacterium]|nr:Xaa-Pro peptidase family protein [Planctomycetaceae bacterium]
MNNHTSNFKNRIKKVRAKLADLKIDALIVTNPSNVSYLSGFWGGDSWLIVTKDSNTLITDSRYTLQAKKQCNLCKIYERKLKMPETLAEIFKKSPKLKTAAVEASVSLTIYNTLKKQLPTKLTNVQGIIESVRKIKDACEIEKIRQAGTVAENALKKVLPNIKIGMTEKHIAAMIDFEMKKAGAEPSFETNVSFGANSAMAHHQPSMQKLKKVDTILIDYGAKLNGYCSDITRCFAVGKVNKFYAKVYKAVLDAQTAAINMLKAGVKAVDADATAKKIIKKENLKPYGHGLGHGLGIDIHELPAVSTFSTSNLQAGNVITVEPGVYLDNKFGIRIEDDVVVTETGCEILTTLLTSDEVPLMKI